MLSIQVDFGGTIKSIDEMLKELTEFPYQMADELTAWQNQDMHRTKGENTTLKENIAETVITQHTPGSGVRRPVRMQRRRMREARVVLKHPAGVRKPILRPMLLEKLVKRMEILLGTVKWQ